MILLELIRQGGLKRWWLALGAIPVLGVLLLAASAFWPRTLPPMLPLPRPNGYDDLVRAGEQARSQPQTSLEETPEAELRAFVGANKEPLALVALASKRESVVPVEFARGSVQKHMAEVGRVRAAVRVLHAAAFLAERDGRLSEAVELNLESLRLGPAVARGGSIIDLLVGVVFEGVAQSRLNAIREQLDVPQCRRVIEALLANEPMHEPLGTVFARDRALAEAEIDWKIRLPMALYAAQFQRLRQPAEDSAEAAVLRTQARRRLLIAHLALRVYRLEQGKDAQRLEDLVPGVLKAVPLDPFSTGPLVYRREAGGGYLLYSIGPNRKDDGGVPFPEGADPRKTAGDYFVEPALPPKPKSQQPE